MINSRIAKPVDADDAVFEAELAADVVVGEVHRKRVAVRAGRVDRVLCKEKQTCSNLKKTDLIRFTRPSYFSKQLRMLCTSGINTATVHGTGSITVTVEFLEVRI